LLSASRLGCLLFFRTDYWIRTAPSLAGRSTVIVGAVTIATLPVAQFPNIAPPEIRLQANYVGADAKTLEDAVATPIDQQVNGVANMT
jgi:multidrug efflux pump subunit AcrB